MGNNKRKDAAGFEPTIGVLQKHQLQTLVIRRAHFNIVRRVEESHCGVVPMNHSNQDGTSSAESEEGRLRIKENTLPFDTYPT